MDVVSLNKNFLGQECQGILLKILLPGLRYWLAEFSHWAIFQLNVCYDIVCNSVGLVAVSFVMTLAHGHIEYQRLNSWGLCVVCRVPESIKLCHIDLIWSELPCWCIALVAEICLLVFATTISNKQFVKIVVQKLNKKLLIPITFCIYEQFPSLMCLSHV